MEDNKIDKALTVRFTSEIIDELKRIARAEERPLSNLVLYFVKKGIEDYNRTHSE